jgi:glycosyltransferase involved in cell wall biosynthesis
VIAAFDITHARINRTGLGRYPAELAPELAQRVQLRTIAAGSGGATAERIARGLAREVAYYPAGLAFNAARAGAQLVHCPTPAPVRGGRLPLVVTVHDLLPLRMPQRFSRQTRLHTRLWIPFVRRAARVLTNSAWTREDVIERLDLPPERVIHTPFGVAERFSPAAADPAALARLGVRAPYILSVATREPRKNLATVLRAYRRLRADGVQLVLAGGRGWGPDELADAGPGALATGYVSDADLAALYAGASAFVFPSLAEGFGLPVLEAMRSGAPVVTSDNSALREVAGDAAVLVEPTSEEDVAEGLRRALADDGELRGRGLERAATFTWAACADATVAAYEQALMEGSSR